MSVRFRLAPLLVLTACSTPEAPREVAPLPQPAVVPEASEASEDDILHAVLTDDRFAMYLHPDVEGRVPVVLSGPARPESSDLELHDAAVLSKDPAALAEGEAFVELTHLVVEGDRAAVKLRYPIEGVVASFGLGRDADGAWSVTSAEIAER